MGRSGNSASHRSWRVLSGDARRGTTSAPEGFALEVESLEESSDALWRRYGLRRTQER